MPLLILCIVYYSKRDALGEKRLSLSAWTILIKTVM